MVSLVGVRLVHVKNELARDGLGLKKVKNAPLLWTQEDKTAVLMAIKGEVCTQRENSCVPGCAFVCAHVRVSARIRAHVCVKERGGAVRNTSASLYVRQRTGGGDALRCCAFFFFFFFLS